MTLIPADRLVRLPPYAFAVLSQRIQQMQAQGIDVIRLDIGSPDLPPPEPVIEALARSARDPAHHGYTGYKGTASFREAVARYYRRRFGVELDSETEVLPLLGSKEGIVNLCLAYLDAESASIVPDIGYPSYSLGAHLAGAQVHWVPMISENNYLLNLTSIPGEIANKAKMLWVNYPNNPTGAVAEPDFYRRMVGFCLDHSILLVSDNPYVDVTFDGYRAGSVLEVPGAKACTVELMSLSKTYNMAGWRLGAAVGCAEALKALLQVKSNIDSGHFRAVYDAGLCALDNTPQAWIDDRNRVYQQRRDRILHVLPLLGLRAHKPAGALYIWAEVTEGDGASFAEQALTNAHVSLTPGIVYGSGGTQYVRISMSVSDERLHVALDRLVAWYNSR